MFPTYYELGVIPPKTSLKRRIRGNPTHPLCRSKIMQIMDRLHAGNILDYVLLRCPCAGDTGVNKATYPLHCGHGVIKITVTGYSLNNG